MKNIFLPLVLFIITSTAFSQQVVRKSTNEFRKPKNLAAAQENPELYGIIFANDIKKHIDLSETEYKVVKDSYNEYNSNLKAARAKGVEGLDEQKSEFEEKRDQKVLSTLESDEKKVAYKEYIKEKKQNK